jgi:hypothetical protein
MDNRSVSQVGAAVDAAQSMRAWQMSIKVCRNA